ncbi:C-x8-C-x5-C-x3-H type zinc finger protein [Purpureocillium lilacinum]|uniref:C-x8-C-x5-C-x3-H type zinc finger protein n=1 Tax=Purpureocillium lilacinum TaxID=33203 RepID=A0A179GZR0_PURLI|nr:C-x8-C-x5-C-x3-H type zinc finger protein [Purpureocillium lilacinum]
MQSWGGQDQNAADGSNQWQTGFVYPGQNGQYDPNQHQWSQPGGAGFSQVGHGAQDGGTADFHFDPSQQGPGGFLGEQQHLAASQPSQPGFHDAHGSIHQQFVTPGQDMLDPSFGNLHPGMFGQQQQTGKIAHGHVAMGQVQNHSHTHPQAFAQHDFSYPAQGGQAFGSPAPPVAHYSPPQLMARPASTRQRSHTPVQQQQQQQQQQHQHPPQQQQQPPQPPQQQQQQPQSQQHFDSNNIHPGLAQGSVYHRPSQASPPQQHAQPQLYSGPSQAYTPTPNGQQGHFQAGVHGHLTYQQFQEPGAQPQLQQQNHLQQHGFPASQPTYQQPGQGTPVQQPQPQVSQPPVPGLAAGASAESDVGTPQPAPAESPAKKRKRATKSTPETAAESPAPAVIDISAESTAKKVEEIDALKAPVPTAEEAKLLAEASKRGKAHGKALATKAIPYLVNSGTIKLPAPKSFDKLSPMVAVPSRSGKPAVIGLGYALPCEVQGRFTSQYKPSLDKAGLDERKDEAKDLLGDYDRAMKALGKRQPKYTEYPHSFKEQLKADEASRNKAEKKAKKEQEEERNKPARPPTRPTDIAAAAAWDVIGIVKIEPSVARTSTLIANRVKEAGEYLINLRGEANRALKAYDQAVKDKVPDDEAAALKHEADQKREALYQALDATLVHADDAVIDNLGGHQKLVLSLVNALIACSKVNDFSGKLPKIVLELFTHFKITKKIAETPNFDTVRKRFEEKGDKDVKDLVREVSAAIRKFTKAAESDTGYAGTSAAGRAKLGIKPADSAKRSRDEEEDTRTVKKIAVEPGSSSLSKKLGQSKILSNKAAPSAAKTSILPGKSRPVAKPAKSEPPAAADSPSASADEKKTPSIATKPAVPKKEVKPVPKPAAAGPTSSVVSSISSLLESINSKKPEPQAPVVKEDRAATPETSEQRAKRLRKEARRKLRVSWKPESELVQIKVFEKDDEEDEGRDVNQLRDAADDRSEGMVLKRRVNVNVDDEDDDLPYQPWEEPSPTDFSHLPEDVRNKSYVTRGGSVGVSTEEQKRIAEREQRELMAIYTDPADIPESSKSPPPEESLPVEPKVGRLPDDPKFGELHRRWQEEQQLGRDLAYEAALKRLDSKNSLSTRLDSILGRLHRPAGQDAASTAHKSSASGAAGTVSKATNVHVPFAYGPTVELNVLEWLKWDKNRLWRDPDPVRTDPARAHQYAPDVELAGRALEGVVELLGGKPYPAVAPPHWLMHDEERVREWWLGHNKEAAARQKRQEEERARAEAEANALRATAGSQDWSAYYAQQQYAPYMALLQQINGGAQQPAATQPPVAPQLPDNQLQSILAAINSQPSQQAQHHDGRAYDFPSFAQGQHSSSSHASGDHDRDWERQDHAGRAGEQHRDDDGRGKKKRTLPPHKPANKALIGTKPCTFWQQGKCARGDKCTFRHD